MAVYVLSLWCVQCVALDEGDADILQVSFVEGCMEMLFWYI